MAESKPYIQYHFPPKNNMSFLLERQEYIRETLMKRYEHMAIAKKEKDLIKVQSASKQFPTKLVEEMTGTIVNTMGNQLDASFENPIAKIKAGIEAYFRDGNTAWNGLMGAKNSYFMAYFQLQEIVEEVKKSKSGVSISTRELDRLLADLKYKGFNGFGGQKIGQILGKIAELESMLRMHYAAEQILQQLKTNKNRSKIQISIEKDKNQISNDVETKSGDHMMLVRSGQDRTLISLKLGSKSTGSIQKSSQSRQIPVVSASLGEVLDSAKGPAPGTYKTVVYNTLSYHWRLGNTARSYPIDKLNPLLSAALRETLGAEILNYYYLNTIGSMKTKFNSLNLIMHQGRIKVESSLFSPEKIKKKFNKVIITGDSRDSWAPSPTKRSKFYKIYEKSGMAAGERAAQLEIAKFKLQYLVQFKAAFS